MVEGGGKLPNRDGYKSLEVWREGIALVVDCYRLTSTFPKSEVFGLVSQINRAVVSIPANIAEGYGRKTIKEFIQFLFISLGSCNELETLLIISRKLGYISESDLCAINEKRRVLACKISALIAANKKKNAR